MERGIQEPEAVESLIDIANRDASAEFEVKLLAGKLQTRDIADRILTAIRSVTLGEPIEEHRLTYTYPDGVRVHILEPPVIHKVCVAQSFKGLPINVERKTRYFDATGGRDMVDAPEMFTRFTLRTEKHIKKDFAGNVNDPKAHIRILHRKSFLCVGGEFRIDFSMVKSKVGNQSLKDVLKNVPTHELEIEYIPRKEPRKPAEVRVALYRIIEKLIGSYQESPALLTHSEMQKYVEEFRYSNIRFYNLVSLERRFLSPDVPHNILKGYTVTNKADGLRAGLYVARDRRVLRVTRDGEAMSWTGLTAMDDKYVEDFLDGEYIESKNLFCIFDVYRFQNKNVKALPLFTTDEDIRNNPTASRLGCAREFVKAINTDFRTVVPGFRIETKLFFAGDGVAMEEAIRKLMDTEFEYETDGLIFTPRASPVAPPQDVKGRVWLRVYKWKPPHQNSIDFLLRFNGDPQYDSVTKGMSRPGTLYISRTPGEDIIYPCETITGEYVAPKLPADLQQIANTRDRVPSPFQPSAPRDPDAHIIMVPVNKKGITHDIDGNRVDDNTIVECSYDMVNKRWNLMRTRTDKTYQYRVLKRSQYGNDLKTAESIWTLIWTPVSDEMLKNVTTNPPDDTLEDDLYYREETSKDTTTVNLRGFHNRIKDSQYQKYVMPGNKLMEIAVGRGGDLHKWKKSKPSLVLGIDFSQNNLTMRSGACVRYLTEKRRSTEKFPKALFAQGDMTKLFEEQDSRYLKIVFGEEAAMTPYLSDFKVKYWDVVACQFAIHYACESEEIFKVFVENLKNHCKSVFFGTCLDGLAVYSLLSGKDRYVLRSGGKTFAQLEKKYTDTGEWKPEFGQRIDVSLESTEKSAPEFLVPFEKVQTIMGEAGFELLETKAFSELYSSQSGISLDGAQQEYSFLHRTFAFKRRDDPTKAPPKEELPVAADAAEATEQELPVAAEAEEEKSTGREEKSTGREEAGEEEKAVFVPVPMIQSTEEKKDEAAPAAPKVRRKIIKKVVEPLPEIVYFFSKNPENSFLSNFYDAPFKMNGIEYKTAEHAYQAAKAATFDQKMFDKIVNAKSAQSAKSFGKKVENFNQETWDAKQDQVMTDIVRAKFTQNPAIRKLLFETGNKRIANADPRDPHWGIGTSSGTTIAKDPLKWQGRNTLGHILESIRTELFAADSEHVVAASEKE